MFDCCMTELVDLQNMYVCMYVRTVAAGTIQVMKCSLSIPIICIHIARPSFSVDDRGNFLGQKCILTLTDVMYVHRYLEY